MTGGQLTCTNDVKSEISLGFEGIGQMTVSNGSVLANLIGVGGEAGSTGTLTIDGGTTSLLSGLAVGGEPNGTGAVWVTGGQLTITNNNVGLEVYIGLLGPGQMTVSNGSVLADNIVLGGNGGNPGSAGTLTIAGGSVTCSFLQISTNLQSQGTVTVAGGTLTILSQLNGSSIFATNTQAFIHITGGTLNIGTNLQLAAGLGTTGVLQVVGGQLNATNGVIGIGNDGTSTNGVGVGHMMVSNATVLASTILLGSSAGGHGDLTILSNGLVSLIGSNALLVPNDVTIQGGELDIFNGTLDCGNAHTGAVTVANNGTADCDDCVCRRR